MENAGKHYTNAPIVQIAPPSLQSGLSLRVTKMKVNLKVTLGNRYQLQASKDRQVWIPIEEAFEASEESILREFSVNETGAFFKLIQLP